MKQFDVVIVGAGPAGSASAIALARKGHAVALIDRSVFPREKLCGDFLNPVNWPILQELGVKERILSQEHEKVTTFRITSFAGGAAIIPLPSNNGEVNFGLGLRRAYLDHALLKGAEKEGVTVLQGCHARAIKRESPGWCVETDNSETARKFYAKLLVGADGRNSWVAHHLGVAGPATSPKSVGFELHLRNRRDVGQNVEIHLFPGGYAGVVRLDNETINLCFTIQKNKLPERVSFEALSDRSLGRNRYLREVLRCSDPLGDLRSAYPIYCPIRRCYGEAFLLVGDAARVTEPVTGEGVYFALMSGLLSAEAIDSALRERNCSAEKLRAYDHACRKTFHRRWLMNALIRMLIYRPALVSPILRLPARRRQWLEALVHFACTPQAAARV